MIGRRPVDTRPERVTCAGAGGANVGVTVMSVDTPGVQDPLVIKQLVARTADMIHDLIASILFQRFAYSCRNIVENFVPAHPLPFSLSPLSDSLQRITNALRIGYLVQGRRPLRAVASTAAGMFGIAFEAPDAQRFLVDETEKTARRLAVKTDRRNNLIMLLDFSWPMRGIVFDPIIPLFHGRIARQPAGSFQSQSRWMKRLPGFSHFDFLLGVI